jgi:ribosomal protein S18 acetylase RimI-like enzyme
VSRPRGRSAVIRPARPDDADRLAEICLRTGAAGQDATELMGDPLLLADLFVLPYAALEPELAFVVDDGTGAQGYIVGTRDTRSFEARAEAEWYPAARERHADPATASGLDSLFLAVLHDPPLAADEVVASHPSHLHIDLLPPFQSGGWGTRLMQTLFEGLRASGSPGVHLGVAEANQRAIGFYEHLGFRQLEANGFTRTLALDL